MTAAQPPPPEPQVEIALFHARLAEITPRVRVAPTIVAINFLIFIAMVATGVGVLNPTADSVLGWGANFGPRTLGGQPWRLLSNVFVHFGILHLALNMFALWNAGALVERIFGPLAFGALYLAAGLIGSVASLAVHPQVVSAGASGAVFGVYGALAAFLLRQRGVIPMPVLTTLRGAALSFIGYNIIIGFSHPSIDNAAHIGGLLGGAAAGAWLVRPLVPGRPLHVVRPVLAVAGAAAIATIAVATLPTPLDFQKTVSDFATEERRILGRFNTLVESRKADEIDDDAFRAGIERDVIPPWRAARGRVAVPRPWPEKQRRVIDLIRRYAETRERAYTTALSALRADDMEIVKQANALHREADALVAELNALKD
jgi:rhomboid protease GluP